MVMSKSKTPSELRRSRLKHERIVSAAAGIAGSVGYQAATIEGIASATGVGKQTIYRWWPSKAELYVETYRHLVAFDVTNVAGATCFEQLHLFLCELFCRYKSTAAGVILVGLVAESVHNERVAVAIEQGLFLERSHLLTDPIEEGIANGEIDGHIDPVWAAEVIIAIIWKRLITSPDKLNPEFSRRILKSALWSHQK
ncbi:hypothetical protein AB833_28590 [Chromatiales bacterium (ex Bugula neritina AB1)]|nr:hypothetical protein AB833_28590 [Chromatiales bacterium (ex Bugula neritina AB1)]